LKRKRKDPSSAVTDLSRNSCFSAAGATPATVAATPTTAAAAAAATQWGSKKERFQVKSLVLTIFFTPSRQFSFWVKENSIVFILIFQDKIMIF